GQRQTNADLSGTMAESKGPGANHPAENGKRVREGRYPLATQGFKGSKYKTWGYAKENQKGSKPGFELSVPGPRTGILVHPGIGFLASVGCLNPCTALPNENEDISFPGSRRRVIALIEDMIEFLDGDFPKENEMHIPRAFAVIDGEP
ncbi:MAG TPA: hypothetical protein VN240_00715, partial [Propylenella sp.]|nr:hypothetical protein [Propylenella sp.]